VDWNAPEGVVARATSEDDYEDPTGEADEEREVREETLEQH
jgi:hypothetical protein